MRLLSATLAAVLMSTTGSARADSFGEVVGGLSIPIANDNWTNLAETSLKLGVRAGATGTSGLGFMVGVDFSPISLDNNGGGFGIGSADFSAQRFRGVVSVVLQKHVLPRLTVSGRAGIALDIAHASASLTIGSSTTSTSDTDLGYGFELGGGLWYELSDTVQLGGELALPMSSHSTHGDGSNGNYTFDYTSWDIDLLFGVRVLSR